jgi:hypothetical protein
VRLPVLDSAFAVQTLTMHFRMNAEIPADVLNRVAAVKLKAVHFRELVFMAKIFPDKQSVIK